MFKNLDDPKVGSKKYRRNTEVFGEAGARSIRSGPMPGADTSPKAPGVRRIGPFPGSAVDASRRHSRIGDGFAGFERCRAGL
jgi:hypothetical protein